MSITPESVQQLLDSDNFGDRIRGINQLRHLDHAIALEMVTPLVTDGNARIRYAAVSSFDSIGQGNLEKSWEILRDRLLNDPETDVKAAAADSLGALKFIAALPDLQQLYYNSSDWMLQVSILAALAELGSAESLDLLKSALESEHSLVQMMAIGALGEIGDKRAIPWILPFAEVDDWQIRHRVAQALSYFPGEETQPTLEKLAQDKAAAVAEEAQRILKS